MLGMGGPNGAGITARGGLPWGGQDAATSWRGVWGTQGAVPQLPTELHGLLKQDLGEKKKKSYQKTQPESSSFLRAGQILHVAQERFPQRSPPRPAAPQKLGSRRVQGMLGGTFAAPRSRTQRLGRAHPPGDPVPCPVSPRYILGMAPRALPAPCWASARVSADFSSV